MTGAVKLTAGLVGLYIAACLDALIYFGERHYHSSVIGSSIGLSAFALMLVVACFESRSVSALDAGPRDVRQPPDELDRRSELALAVMITQMDLFNRLLKTTPLTRPQFGLAVAAAVGLFVLWETGKLIARRRQSSTSSPDGDVAGA